MPRFGHGRRRGFTLLELLLSVALLALVATVIFMTFSTVTTAWRRGTTMADHLHHGDYVLDQLVMGLRSAYRPEAAPDPARYGFLQEDNGAGESAQDKISWVKIGGALVGRDAPYAGTAHRVEFTVGEDAEGVVGAQVRAWAIDRQVEDFDPEEVEPILISGRIIGFDCRTAEKLENDEIEWMDEWEDTNKVPRFVELTLFLEPAEEDRDPIELKRVLQIPIVEPQ